MRQFGPDITAEFRAGFRTGDIGFTRPHPDIPTLTVLSGLVSLPGSNQPTTFRNRDRNFELSNSTVVSRRSHILTAGAGLLIRRPETLLAFEREGRYSFSNLISFAEGRPEEFKATLNRPEVQRLASEPRFDRTRRNNSFYGFVQDAWRINRRLATTLGLRYEHFGTLKNVAAQDALILPAPAERPDPCSPARPTVSSGLAARLLYAQWGVLTRTCAFKLSVPATLVAPEAVKSTLRPSRSRGLVHAASEVLAVCDLAAHCLPSQMIERTSPATRSMVGSNAAKQFTMNQLFQPSSIRFKPEGNSAELLKSGHVGDCRCVECRTS
jgi:hypothetical protein